ncbi:hypothetical protein [Nitrospirillum iridis]|uniref:Uncharacterized protein n=1 Tax=Nitrospirillum iridis TaxID=765888 RepID=A0A7X0B683_9PROT|nr:hypothetical protein [Nitrospirillum iridis]MBB6255216.1 hypothetical protein [Nitrospirillum iridis]
MDWKIGGAIAFGAVIGWYLYFINRYRKGDVSLGDITTVIGVIGGAAVLSVFDKGTDVFGAYGVGLAVGFFGYFLVLIFLVRRSSGFNFDYFIDGRRPNPPGGWGFGPDSQQPVHPMTGLLHSTGVNSTQSFHLGQALPSQMPITSSLDVNASSSIDYYENNLIFAQSKADRVNRAKALLSAGAIYPRGCSEFVCAVLAIPYRQANDLMGNAPSTIGTGPIYIDLEPGDIAGWVAEAGSGHVAVYIGEGPDCVFIDVREPGAKPRSKNGYYNHEMFKAPF